MKHFFFSILVSLIAIHSYCQTGSPINSFGTSGNANTVVGSGSTTADMAVQSDGKLIVAGYATVGGNSDFALARFKSDGTLDPSFNGTGKQSTAVGSASDYLSAIALQSDGKIVAVGYCVVGSVYNIGLARYLSDGTLDAGFSGDGKLTTSLGASGSTTGMDVAIQGDGKIVVVGSYNSNMIVVRYNTDGSLDTSFDLDGIVTTSFGASTTQNASSVALQSDGKIVVGGSSQNQFALVRYNSDGSLDTSFDTDGKLTTTINASGTSQINSLVLQSNGSIVAAGRYSYYDFMTDANAYNVALARYTSSGALDTNFDADGKLTFVVSSFNPLDEAKSVTVQSDGKMLVTGTGFTVARLNSNGSFDNSFDNDGKVLGTNGSVVKLWTNRVYVGNASGGLGLSAFQNDFTALPLRLVAFHATAKNSQVVLSWQTAAEQNTKNFKVERSADGVHYLTIGDVKAAGNSPEMSYLFTDAGPLAGKNFYRLKMMDNDGRFTFSNVLAVTVETEQQLFLPANRVAGRLPVYLRGEGSALLHIVDATGKILAQERLFLNGNKTHEVAVQALPAGQYFLLLQTKDHQEVKPFFKQ